jgi:hypothetical protein
MRPRMLNGLAVFDLDATSDWEALAAPVAQVQAPEVIAINELSDAKADKPTDVPGVLWRRVRPTAVLYGERTGVARDANKVAEGRLRELRQMNDHHVYDYIPESEIPKGQRIETARRLDDLKLTAEDPSAVRSRIIVQQYNQTCRDDVFQGTPPLKAVSLILSLASTKQPLGRRVIGIWDSSCILSRRDGRAHDCSSTSKAARLPVGAAASSSRHSSQEQVVWAVGC